MVADISVNQPTTAQALATLDQLRKDVTLFQEDQIRYLEKLAKYSNKKNSLVVLKPRDMPLRKQAFIKDNFTYLPLEDQILYNQSKMNINTQRDYAKAVALGVGASFFIYYVVSAPLTRSLFKETCKSLILGGLSGLGYYKYQLNKYNDEMHDFYIKILAAKKTTLRRAYIPSSTD